MENKIETNNLVFHKYDADNNEYKNIVNKLSEDELTNKFFDNLLELATESSTDDNVFVYLVEFEEKIIGVVTLCYINDTTTVFSQTVLPECRGNSYASLIREELISYLYSIGIDNVLGYVKIENENIINNLMKSGFSLTRVKNSDYFQVNYSERSNKNVR